MVSENVILRSNGPAHHRPFSEVQNKVSATLQEKKPKLYYDPLSPTLTFSTRFHLVYLFLDN